MTRTKNRLPRSVHYGACLDSCRLLVIQRSLRTHYARNRAPKVSATDSYNTDAPARLSDEGTLARSPRHDIQIRNEYVYEFISTFGNCTHASSLPSRIPECRRQKSSAYLAKIEIILTAPETARHQVVKRPLGIYPWT